jgi:chitosanase
MALADLCFPDDGLSGDNGHDANDVLFIGFTSQDAFPQDAAWNAGSTQEFENSIKDLGDQLVAGLNA